jgi:DNA-directed RNA polymerase subunit K/omega
MTEDKAGQDLQDQGDAAQLQFDPRRKYERIMLAAAEATRLNDEVRRKGTKLSAKVTIEALKRVDAGKVKSELRDPTKPRFEEEEVADPIPEIPSSTLFAPAPEEAAPTDEADDDAETGKDDQAK